MIAYKHCMGKMQNKKKKILGIFKTESPKPDGKIKSSDAKCSYLVMYKDAAENTSHVILKHANCNDDINLMHTKGRIKKCMNQDRNIIKGRDH